MSYLVLARKWRPRRFEDMVGQAHVLKALVNALAQGRLHHAYLFSGTRGVGKTTVARIFAKALNCERGVGADPCGACSTCIEIDEGRYVDLLEVDAASRTKVDETRELLENVHYAPSRGRYKVYLIDEVHMFSNHSFNALLKTLEEPPPHVKFLLATTDPKKLPVTILSRCLQFNLKRLGIVQIEAQLERILVAENVGSDRESRRLVAEAADGSLRDALSLLDQAIAFGGGTLRADEVAAMLGAIDRRKVRQLLETLVAGDAAGVIAKVDELAVAGADFVAVLGELLNLLQRLAVTQLLGDPADDGGGDDLADLAGRLTPEECQLHYQIGLMGRRDLPLAPDPRGGFEMVMLRMLAFRPSDGPARLPQRAAPASTAPAATEPTRLAPASAGVPPPISAADRIEWDALANDLPISGLVKSLALHCAFRSWDGDVFRLLLAPADAQLRTAKCESKLEEALRGRFGNGLRLIIEIDEQSGVISPALEKRRRDADALEAAARSIDNDPNVRALRDKLGAVIESVDVRN
jgi:DNA polymerase-3 subunit gamma/tau